MKNRKNRKNRLLEINEPLSSKPDTSPIIPQRSKLRNDLHIIERSDLTDNQKKCIDIILDKKTKMLFLSGPAGTSKSFISVYCALKLLNLRKVSDLIYVRSVVESADQKMGYLPGEIDNKLSPYLEPLYDKLGEFLPKNEIDALRKDQRINAVPISFLRGLNWNARVIISDESQTITTKEITTLITRVGEYSKIIIAGDPEQSDINGKTGFSKMVNLFDDDESRQNGIYVFRFTEEDIVRSSLVKFIVKKLRSFV